MENNTTKQILRIVLSLTITAAAAALMLSVVNLITEGRIAQNRSDELISAMQAIYPDMNGFETLEYEFDTDVEAVYKIGNDYCIVVTPKGFSDELELMVGVASDGKVSGVRILNSSETPGIGTKIEGEYIDSFVGRSGSLMYGANVDAISGATYSSKAVINGVNSALACVKSLTADYSTESEAEETHLSQAEPPVKTQTEAVNEE